MKGIVANYKTGEIQIDIEDGLLPPPLEPLPPPPRDLAAEIDDLKARIKKMEQK